MRNVEKGFIKWIVLITIILIIGGSIYVYKNKRINNLEVQPFQNYDRNSFIQYDQSRYYSLKYPKGWAVYQVKGQGTMTDSILILPQDMANKHIKITDEEILSSSEAFEVTEAVKRDEQQVIKLYAEFQYSSYIPPEKQEAYFQYLIQRTEELAVNSNSTDKALIITFKDKPALYRTFNWTQNNIITKSISVSWFAQPDPQGREKEAGPLMVTLLYTSPPEKFSEETFNGVLNSVEEHLWKEYLDAMPIGK